MNTKKPGIATGIAAWPTKGGGPIMQPWRGAAAVLLFLAATPLSAQQPGDTVRLSGELVDVVVEADSAGLLLSAGYVPWAGIRSLEVWGGIRTRAWRGFKYGVVAGGIVGAGVGVLFCREMDCVEPVYTVGSGTVTVAGLVGLAGALMGSTIKREIWTAVPIPGGVSLRLTVGGR